LSEGAVSKAADAFRRGQGARYHLEEGGTPRKRRLPGAVLGRLRRLGLPPRHFCRRRGHSRPRPTILEDFGLAAGLLGMIGMRARARSAGGDVTVRCRPGEGVLIEERVSISGPAVGHTE